MRALQRLLLLLGALILPAAASFERPDPAREALTPTWRSLRDGPAPVAYDARTEWLPTARASDKRSPRTASSGGGAPEALGPTPWWSAAACGTCSRQVGSAFDDRVLVAQHHRRVNGSANANGARA